MPQPSKIPRNFFSKGRLEAFSDGVLAIAMTILVFDIKLPDGIPEQELASALVRLEPKLASFLLSFALIGVYWVAQHGILHNFVRRVDRNLLWLNNALLLGIVLLPFLAALIGSYNQSPLVLVLYGANLIFLDLLLQVILSHVTGDPELRVEPINWRVVKLTQRRMTVALVASAIGTLAALISPNISLALYFLVPLLYVLPTRFDRLWQIGMAPDPGEPLR